MVWNISQLHRTPVIATPAANPTSTPPAPNVANATTAAPGASTGAGAAKKPMTAEDFSKLSFKGESKFTGLASIDKASSANAVNSTKSASATTANTSTTAPNNTSTSSKTAGSSAIDQLPTDAKRNILNKLQSELKEDSQSKTSGSASKQALMNAVSKSLDGVDVKGLSDKMVNQVFDQVTSKMKEARPNDAYQQMLNASMNPALPRFNFQA